MAMYLPVLLVLLGKISFSEQQACNPLDIKALGRVALIGDLYDARTDSFCGLSVFTEEVYDFKTHTGLPGVEVKDADATDIKVHDFSRSSDKYDHLDVDASINIKIKVFELGGSAHYLNDDVQSAKILSTSVVYKIRTHQQYINLYDKGLIKRYWALDALQYDIGTHVVTGVLWGADAIIRINYDKHEVGNNNEIGGSLTIGGQLGPLELKGTASVDFTDLTHNNRSVYTVTVIGDILPTNGSLPVTVEQSLAFIRELPNLVANNNDGWGIPVLYQLHPISNLPKSIFPDSKDKLIEDLQESLLKQVTQMFDELGAVKKELYDFKMEISINREFVRREDLRMVGDLHNKVTINEVELRSNLTSLLLQVKLGEIGEDSIDELLHLFNDSDASPLIIGRQIKQWERMLTKIRNAKELVGNGSTYLGKYESIEDKVLDGQRSVVLYFSDEAMIDERRWIDNKLLLAQSFWRWIVIFSLALGSTSRKATSKCFKRML